MEIQLQSVLLPGRDVCDVEMLYYHRHGKWVDFDGYFNLLYIEKRKAYTRIENLHLSLWLKGYRSLVVAHNRKAIKRVELDSGLEKKYVIEIPYGDYKDGVFWFSLAEDEEVSKRKVHGWFGSEIAPELCQEVNIGIDICTYQRESYVARNLGKLKDRVLDNGELDVSSHVWIYVVDNGKTLNHCQEVQEIVKSCANPDEAENGERICIIPNKNIGGAGGFTRGMLQVLKDKKEKHLTHVLLMDDDAVIEPDTLVRIYGLLVTRKPEWKDVTVGGAMLREDYPYILFCAGEMWKDGEILRPEINLDLRSFSNATDSCLIKTGYEKEWYSGWWCCCYSLNVVREDNLPIPLFLHYDDVEFGLRNQEKGVVFLNGIGVWHKGFELAFPGHNLYYDVRNNLIQMALYGTEGIKRTAAKYVLKCVTVAALRLCYDDVSLVYRSFLDFLRGPQWLYKKDADKLNLQIREASCKRKMESLEKVLQQLSIEDIAYIRKQLKDYEETLGIDVITESWKKSKKGNWLWYLTYNGWLLPSDKKGIQLIASTDSPFKGFRKKRILLYEHDSGKALLAERNYRELIKILKIYAKILIAFQDYFDTACDNYRNNIKNITNQTAWEEYLKEK